MEKATPKNPLSAVTIHNPERALHQKMQTLRTQLAGDKQASVTFLRRAGILTRSGNLAKTYR